LPFLALSPHQRAANGGKRRHEAKAYDRRVLLTMKRAPATSSVDCGWIPGGAAFALKSNVGSNTAAASSSAKRRTWL
jgi:hypothetical protein